MRAADASDREGLLVFSSRMNVVRTLDLLSSECPNDANLGHDVSEAERLGNRTSLACHERMGRNETSSRTRYRHGDAPDNICAPLPRPPRLASTSACCR